AIFCPLFRSAWACCGWPSIRANKAGTTNWRAPWSFAGRKRPRRILPNPEKCGNNGWFMTQETAVRLPVDLGRRSYDIHIGPSLLADAQAYAGAIAGAR